MFDRGKREPGAAASTGRRVRLVEPARRVPAIKPATSDLQIPSCVARPQTAPCPNSKPPRGASSTRYDLATQRVDNRGEYGATFLDPPVHRSARRRRVAGASGGRIAQPQAEQTPTAEGTGGAAATVDLLATQAAVEALRNGANAVDAAVVAAAVLGVVEPFSCGIGGGGFMVIRTAGGKVTTIDHRETAPAAMHPGSFIDPATGTPLPFADARWSGLSAGVPGTVEGWDEALQRYGTMSLGEALQPAIEIARDGFLVDQIFFGQIRATSTSSTTSCPRAPSTSTRTARRATSARPSVTPTWRGPTNGSCTSAPRASIAAPWPTPW